MLIVMKFGGTSVGSAERISQAAQLATSGMAQGHRVVVVTSAMSGVTNALIDAATAASKGQYLKKLSVSSTMGVGVRVDQASLMQ